MRRRMVGCAMPAGCPSGEPGNVEVCLMHPHTVNRRRRRLWYTLIAVSAIGLAALLVDIMPPGSRTLGHMMKVRSILKTVYARMGRVPDSLEELVRLAGQVDPSVDPGVFRGSFPTFPGALCGTNKGFNEELGIFVMYGRCLEHSVYSRTPLRPSQARQDVDVPGRAIVRVPPRHRERSDDRPRGHGKRVTTVAPSSSSPMGIAIPTCLSRAVHHQAHRLVGMSALINHPHSTQEMVRKCTRGEVLFWGVPAGVLYGQTRHIPHRMRIIVTSASYTHVT